MVICSALKKLWENADEHFKQIFKDVTDLTNFEICMPRVCDR